MGVVQIQLVDLFTRSVIKMMTLRSKPKGNIIPVVGMGAITFTFKTQRAKRTFAAVEFQCLLFGRSCRSRVMHDRFGNLLLVFKSNSGVYSSTHFRNRAKLR